MAKQKGKSQIEVHLGSGQANQWNTMRNSISLNNNPSPNASTGFKLDKGNAYRKLSESWPIYQPIDGTKQGKGKDSSGWNSEENTAAGDAPLVSTSGGGSSNKFTKYLNTKQALERIGILFDGDGMRNVVSRSSNSTNPTRWRLTKPLTPTTSWLSLTSENHQVIWTIWPAC
ncbi:hypothetical protein CM3_00870 [Mycoplasmoides genitalium M6282]|nr:hypothetical protein CM3_00870 [Mycoplasmoides genitalium M6282]